MVLFLVVCTVFLAIPVNGGLAARYASALLPEKGNNLTYEIRTKPIFRKTLFLFFSRLDLQDTLVLDNINYL